MSRFSNKVTKKLLEAGWYPGRRVDIEQKFQLIAESGYILTQIMMDFLIEFDGVSLTYSNGDNQFDFISYDVDFHPIQRVIRQGLVGDNVIPVGSFYNSNLLISITNNQSMCCYDEFENVYKIGDYYDEGINFICMYGLNPYKYLESKII